MNWKSLITEPSSDASFFPPAIKSRLSEVRTGIHLLLTDLEEILDNNLAKCNSTSYMLLEPLLFFADIRTGEFFGYTLDQDKIIDDKYTSGTPLMIAGYGKPLRWRII